MACEYQYELTDRWGKNLLDSMGQHEIEHRWYNLVDNQARHIREDYIPGGCVREEFVDHLMSKTGIYDIEEIARIANVKGNFDVVKAWLMENACPPNVLDEDDMLDSFTWERAEFDIQCWFEEIDPEDDFEVALFFELLEYPPHDMEKGEHLETEGRRYIPAAKANEMLRLERRMNEAARESTEGYDSRDCRRLRHNINSIKQSCILVGGVDDGYARIELPGWFCVDEIPNCPYCGYVVDFDIERPVPKTSAGALSLLIESLDEDDPPIECYSCGSGGHEYTAEWLRGNGVSLPPEYTDEKLWLFYRKLAA